MSDVLHAQLRGAFLTGGAIGVIAGLLVAFLVFTWVLERLDEATTLPDPKAPALVDDDTVRIDTTYTPSNLPHRRGGSTIERAL